ncbi:hypothetical protein FOZ62_013149, partial [Perkinsus olseni]
KFVCGDKAQRQESEQEPMSSATDSRGRKRKSCERIRAPDSERGDTSFSPDSRVSSEPEGTLPHNYCDSRRASEIYRLRKEVSSLKCSNAGLRSIAEERLERIRQLEAVVWAPQATADGGDGSEKDGSSEVRERAEGDEWKKEFEERMEAKEQVGACRDHIALGRVVARDSTQLQWSYIVPSRIGTWPSRNYNEWVRSHQRGYAPWRRS